MIYIEQAEGGLTRMVAVFGTHKPVVEAVRSVRASDAELLSQYGPITLVASGGGGDSLTTLDHSIVKGVINDRGGPGFSRDGNRPAPYNLQSNLAQVAAAVQTGGSKDVGFSLVGGRLRGWPRRRPPTPSTPWSAAPRSPSSGTPGLHRYVRTIGGAPLARAPTARRSPPRTCWCSCARSRVNPQRRRRHGNPSQFTHSVGSGRVVLFRNGKRIEGKWSRATGRLADHGSPTWPASRCCWRPGGAIVVLATNGAPV